MRGKFGLLSPGKASSHSTASYPVLCVGKASSYSTELPSFFSFFFLCAVFLCFHTTGCEAYSFTADGCGIFNVRMNLGACRSLRTKEGHAGTHKPAQEFDARGRGAEEKKPTCPSTLTHHCRGWNPGSWDLIFHTL